MTPEVGTGQFKNFPFLSNYHPPLPRVPMGLRLRSSWLRSATLPKHVPVPRRTKATQSMAQLKISLMFRCHVFFKPGSPGSPSVALSLPVNRWERDSIFKGLAPLRVLFKGPWTSYLKSHITGLPLWNNTPTNTSTRPSVNYTLEWLDHLFLFPCNLYILWWSGLILNGHFLFWLV